MPVWPTSLEQYVDADSFNYKYGETVLRSDVDIGPKKLRRRFTRPINTASVSFILHEGDFATFDTFYNTTTNAGVTPFDLAHPITGVVKQWRFTETPSVRPLGGNEFTVAFELEEMV